MSDLAHLALVGTSGAPPAAIPRTGGLSGSRPPAAVPAAAPSDAEVAAGELAALKANPDWVSKHLQGSAETRAELEKLVERMHARPAGSVQLGAGDAQAQRNQVADYMAEAAVGLSPAHIQEIRDGTPNSPEIYEAAMRMKRALMADSAWIKKYMDNDFEARRTLTLISIIEANGVRLA
jgi:hypothetical protein